MSDARTPEEMQRLLNTSRQLPRPSYYSVVSGGDIQISYDFETYLITLDNASKNELVTRLRKASDQVSGNLDRDGLALAAASYEVSAVGSKQDELALELGDYSSFSKTELQSNQLAETSELVNDLGTALGGKLFQRDQAENEIIAAGTIQSALKTGSGSQAQKKQIQSWITLITAYITKA
jgi:hypothetical protein